MCVKITNMFILSLHKHICKSASIGPKHLRIVAKNGIKFVLKVVYTQENKTH
jgi:hypothetical protein